MMVSARRKIAAQRNHLAAAGFGSWTADNVDLLFNGTGVRTGCQAQVFVGARQRSLDVNGPPPRHAGQNIGRRTGFRLQLAAVASPQRGLADRFMAPAVIDRYEKDLPGIVLDVKIYVRDRTSR